MTGGASIGIVQAGHLRIGRFQTVLSLRATVLVVGADLRAHRSSNSCDGVRGGLIHSTNSIVHRLGVGHSDIPILSKISSPRVLDDPEFPTVGSSPPPYSSDGVISSHEAVSRIHNTIGVLLPCGSVN